MLELAIAAFTTLFVTVGPVEVAAIFLAVTPKETAAQRRTTAIAASIVAAAVLLAFALGGRSLLAVLGVGMPAFRTAGGILLLTMSSNLLFAERTGLTSITPEEEREAESHSAVAVFPLAIPMIAGPGTITAILLLMARAKSIEADVVVLACIVGICLLTLLCMLGATRLVRFLGLTGTNVIARVSGILLAALAMQFIFDGLAQSGILSGNS
jgi:multiple antibiotic resistance protein